MLREVKYLSSLGVSSIPSNAASIYEKNETLWKFHANLEITSALYNKVDYVPRFILIKQVITKLKLKFPCRTRVIFIRQTYSEAKPMEMRKILDSKWSHSNSKTGRFDNIDSAVIISFVLPCLRCWWWHWIYVAKRPVLEWLWLYFSCVSYFWPVFIAWELGKVLLQLSFEVVLIVTWDAGLHIKIHILISTYRVSYYSIPCFRPCSNISSAVPGPWYRPGRREATDPSQFEGNWWKSSCSGERDANLERGRWLAACHEKNQIFIMLVVLHRSG